MGTNKLDWIAGDLGELQGDLERAKRFYAAVRAGFRDADERSLSVPAVVIVGAQWGDEGKGKITDYLARAADTVVRYQGGNNERVYSGFGVGVPNFLILS